MASIIKRHEEYGERGRLAFYLQGNKKRTTPKKKKKPEEKKIWKSPRSKRPIVNARQIVATCQNCPRKYPLDRKLLQGINSAPIISAEIIQIFPNPSTSRGTGARPCSDRRLGQSHEAGVVTPRLPTPR